MAVIDPYGLILAETWDASNDIVSPTWTARSPKETTMSQKREEAPEKTTVVKDPDSPTGYSVTFRYKDSDATRVRLSGRWLFSDKARASLATSLNATPEEWLFCPSVWANGRQWI
jgi:hypothetical protein